MVYFRDHNSAFAKHSELKIMKIDKKMDNNFIAHFNRLTLSIDEQRFFYKNVFLSDIEVLPYFKL